MNDKVPSARGSRVKALVYDNGTTLVPGLILRATRDRAHVLLRKDGKYVSESYRLNDWRSDYLTRPGDELDPRIERAFTQLAIALREVNGRLPSLSGDESISDADSLEGRTVNVMLHNGICVIAAHILRVFWRDGERHIAYQRPDTAGESTISLHGIGHLHVFSTREEPEHMQFNPEWYVHIAR